MRYIPLLDILLIIDSSVLNVEQSVHGTRMVVLSVIQGKAEGVIYVSGADIILGNLLSKKKLLKGWHLLMKIVVDGGLLIGMMGIGHPRMHTPP